MVKQKINIKQNINLFLFSLFSFIALCASSTLEASAGIGVKDMFQNMTEEELAMQVQQGEDLMHYMETQATPEERQAFEEAMTQMFQQLSPADLEEINAIAEAVEGKIKIHERDEPKKVEPAKVQVKTTENKVSADDTIKSLLLAINNIIDTILRKINSDLLLTDYFSSHSIKSSIALFQRLISLLESKQNIQRLSDKKDKDNEALMNQLKEFKTKLSKKEKDFYIDDSFGASSKKSYKDNVAKLDSIIEDFNHGIESIMPEIEKFIRKYESENQELAALYQKLKEASVKHAKSAQMKQGSTPVKKAQPKSTNSNNPNLNQSGKASINNGNNNYYDSYDDYNSFDTNAKDNNSNLNKDKPKDKKTNPEVKKEQSEEDRTLSEILENIEEYLEAYDDKDYNNAVSLHKEFIGKQPKYALFDTVTKADSLQNRSAHILDFNKNSLMFLEAFEAERNKAIQANLSSLATILNNCQSKVGKLDLPQIKKLQENPSYKQIINRAKQYVNIGNNFIVETKKTSDLYNVGLQNDLDHLFTTFKSPEEIVKVQKTKDVIDKLEKEYKNMTRANKELYRKVEDTADVFERSVKSAERRRKRHQKPEAKKAKNRDEELEENIMKKMKIRDAATSNV